MDAKLNWNRFPQTSGIHLEERARATSTVPAGAHDGRRSVVLEDVKPSSVHGLRPRKTSTTIRLDDDVLAWLRQPGPGYQSRINAILRREMLRALRGPDALPEAHREASQPVGGLYARKTDRRTPENLGSDLRNRR